VEERTAKSPAQVSFRLQGMGVELGEVFPGGFEPDRADGVPPHRYARTDLFPNDPDYSWETVDAVSQPHEFVELLMQQYVVPRTNITLDASLIESPGDTEGVTSAKFRGEESVRSIVKEQAFRAFHASWGVGADGKFFFLRKRDAVLATFREGTDISLLEESRDRDLLFNRVSLTGGYVYDEQLGSDIAMRGFYRWRGNYIQPASRDRHGERRIRIWIPWIRTDSDSRQFVKEFFRVYAQPTSRYLVEVDHQSTMLLPWGGRIRLLDRSGNEIIRAMVETIRVQFDHAPRFRMELGPEDPHSYWPEPPHDERWEIPGQENQNRGGGSELSFSSGDIGPSGLSSSSLTSSTQLSSSLEQSSSVSSGVSAAESDANESSSGDGSSEADSSEGQSSSGADSSGEGSSAAGSSGLASSGSASSSSDDNSSDDSSSGSDGSVCAEQTATNSASIGSGPHIAWVATGGGSGTVTLDRFDLAQTLRLTDFGFSLPSGKTVVDITCTVNLISPDNETNGIEAGTATIVSGAKSGSKMLFQGGSDLWPTSATDKVFGGGGDTWGTGWTTDDFNSAGLRVNITGVEQSSSTDPHDGTINSVKLNVCYTP